MRLVFTLCMLALLSGSATAQEQSLFNGNDLAGWGGAPGWWTVEDGAITSESTPEKPCHNATYLVWEGGEPADFELSLDFKLNPNSPKANSGVQIRSERRPDWDTFGYQADMDAAGQLVGFVYHHGRGLIAARGEKVHITTDGKREAEKVADSEELKAVFKAGEWNHYRIVCLGPDITLYVNDVLMCEFSDHDSKQARSEGIIALQMHPGPPMKVQFKNIVLKTLTAGQEAALEGESALIAVLESAADHQEKVDACRELARIGTSAAVPALAALLADEKLSHMARYGLASIPGPDADEALRAALDALQGEQLAGLVNTIGQRRDAQAVGALTGLLSNGDTAVAQAAATALGRIGTADAANALQAVLGETEGAQQAVICDALMDCAESFRDNENEAAALAIYDALRALPNAPAQVREAALRGDLSMREDEDLSFLAEPVRSGDDAVALVAIQAAVDRKAPGIVPFVAAEMGRLHPTRQALLIAEIGRLGDAEAVPHLLGWLSTADPSVRLASTRAMVEIGGSEVIEPLMGLMKDADSRIAEVATTGLAGLPGSEVDEAVINSLVPPDPDREMTVMEKMMAEAEAIQGSQGMISPEQDFRIKMMEMVARRRIMNAMPNLVEWMNDENDKTRLTAMKSYGVLAGAEEIPVLLETLLSSTRANDHAVIGKAIAAAYRRGGEPDVCVSQIASALDKAVDEAKPTLIRLLKMIGGPEALAVVQQVAEDPNEQVKAAANRAVSEWRTP